MKMNRNHFVASLLTFVTIFSLCFAKGSTEYSDLESVVGSEPEVVEDAPRSDDELEKTIGGDFEDLDSKRSDDDKFLDEEPAPKKKKRIVKRKARRNDLSDESFANEPRGVASEELVGNRNTSEITNIELSNAEGRPKVIVTSTTPLKYQELKSPQIKQLTYVFENTRIPQSLQKAFDSQDKNSPVNLLTLFQVGSSTIPLGKLVVQLKQNRKPAVIQKDQKLIIEFEPMTGGEQSRAVVADGQTQQSTEENIYSNTKVFTGRKIAKLEIKNSDIQDVLRLIAKYSGFSIAIGEDVTGKIGTLSLRDVPWDQAFALILQSKKLGYIQTGNVIRVGTLSSLKAEKDEAIANENSKIKSEPLKTVLIPISYAKAQDMSTQAKSFLTERGSIEVDKRTNTVIIKDIEASVSRIQKLFSALDTQPARVSVQAKIMEMSENFSRNLGFRSTSLAQDIIVSGGNAINVSGGLGLSNEAGNFLKISAPNFAKLQTDFRLGELENKVKTLATPSLAVVANNPATITSSVSFFVFNADAVAGGTIIPGVRQITANLSMDVTPIVAGDGSIFMTLNIRNEIPSGKPPDLQINARNLTTQVLVENGETAVVGGLFQNTVNVGREGIPFLMNIPLLGFFFSNSTISDNKNEIFVFLTAKILNPEEAFKRAL